MEDRGRTRSVVRKAAEVFVFVFVGEMVIVGEPEAVAGLSAVVAVALRVAETVTHGGDGCERAAIDSSGSRVVSSPLSTRLANGFSRGLVERSVGRGEPLCASLCA